MNKLRRFVAVVVALTAICSLSAAERILSMREVSDMMARRGVDLLVEQNLLIEGYVVSQYNGSNNEMNVNVHYASMKNYDLSTGYIESLSGDIGFKMSYAERPVAKLFPRYAKVVLSLKGTTLSLTI